jgi:hypothetical protein
VDAAALARLDADGYHVERALTYGGPPPGGSHSTPHAFVCGNARTYWLKRQAQQGLAAELIASRLGELVQAAPGAVIVELTSQAALADGSTDDLLGVGVGIEDRPGMDDVKHVTQLRPDGTLDPAKLSPAARGLILIFQTWLGLGDAHFLIDLRTGHILSHDHGEWGSDPSARTDPIIVSPQWIPADFAQDETVIRPALKRITSISDEAILHAVARMPETPEWNAGLDRRLALAEYLAWRRDRLPEVISGWWR